MNFSKETIQIVNSYTYMNERFMTAAFSKLVAQHILSVILDTELRVLDIKKRFAEDERFHANCRFDVLAEDGSGKVYNIEFQTFSGESVPGRIPFYGLMGADEPETYIVFVTEKDVLGQGLPIYHIESRIEGTGKTFKDGQHIIYVNGENKDTSTALGQLMADMQQKDAAKISNKLLADRMDTLKNSVVFETMCREANKLVTEIAAEAVADEQEKAIRKLAKVCREFGLEPNAIAQKLMSEYAITEDEAEAYAAEACNH